MVVPSASPAPVFLFQLYRVCPDSGLHSPLRKVKTITGFTPPRPFGDSFILCREGAFRRMALSYPAYPVIAGPVVPGFSISPPEARTAKVSFSIVHSFRKLFLSFLPAA